MWNQLYSLNVSEIIFLEIKSSIGIQTITVVPRKIPLKHNHVLEKNIPHNIYKL